MAPMKASRYERLYGLADMPSAEACWEWLGNRAVNGYGRIWGDGRSWFAHRLSYEVHNGPIPPGLCICHHCDNPSCINPSHLFAGTQAENLADMRSKGRHAVPPRRRRRFSQEEADLIRAQRAAGRGERELAREYGCPHSVIGNVVHRRGAYRTP